MSACTSRRWGHKWRCLSPIFIVLLLMTTAIAHGTSEQPSTVQQAHSEPVDPQKQGQLLYRVAMRNLQIIEANQAVILEKEKHDSHKLKLLEPLVITVHSVLESFTNFFPFLQWINSDNGVLQNLKLQNEEYLSYAKRMLEKAANTYHSHDAMLTLAEMNFFAKYTCPRNFTEAFTFYNKLASTGNATAQAMVGFFYSTGIGNVVKKDQARALIYNTFAAHGGNTMAEMTMGYRSLFGIGTEQKCEDAAYYYRKVAEKSIRYFLSGPYGGHAPPLMKVRLSDEVGGVYGYGASMMTDRRFKQNTAVSDKHVSIEEVLQYWRYHAQARSDFDTQLMLGQIYYQGTRSIPRDYKEALTFFREVTEKITPGKVPEALHSSKKGKAIGQAAGYLGRMYLRGEGVEQDFEMAYKWFRTGAELKDPIAENGMGVLYLNGLGVPPNRDEAIEYFKRAANQQNPEAQVNLAIEYAKHESTLQNAILLFTMAAEAKHILAYWYLAQLNSQGLGRKASCQTAVSFYKSIAERGDWLDPTVETGYSLFLQGDKEGALLHYMLAAERGYEVAQSNVAYMLDHDKQLLKLESIFGWEEDKPQDKDAEEYALTYWTRSANQNNVDSRVKMGDYYFRGIGTPVDYKRAADCYRIAAEFDFSPMAMWNLGWMYENGIGVPRDFHLAKRSYDNALSTHPDSYLPIKISLMKLYLKYYWGRITGSETGQYLFPKDRSDDGESKQRNNDQSEEAAAQEMRRRKEIEAYEHERAHWEIEAEEELRMKYKQIRKRAEQEEDGDFMIPGSGYDREQYGDEEYSEEDELIESLVILGLCLLIGWLVYIRQFWYGNQVADVPNNATEEQNNQRQFPQDQ